MSTLIDLAMVGYYVRNEPDMLRPAIVTSANDNGTLNMQVIVQPDDVEFNSAERAAGMAYRARVRQGVKAGQWRMI
jgi:hypothetical protein